MQLRRPATLLPYRGVLRVGARNRAGPLRSGGRTFSSGTSLASLNVRKTFVLRDARHSKGQRRINCISVLSALVQLGKWQPRTPDGDCKFTGESWLLSRPKSCVATRHSVYSLSTWLRPRVNQPDPPGLIHDDPRLLPPWRGSSFFGALMVRRFGACRGLPTSPRLSTASWRRTGVPAGGASA